MEKLKEILARLPTIPMLLLWLAWLGYDFWNFTNDPASDLLRERAAIQEAKNINATLQVKIKEVNEFVKNLEATKVELRNIAQKLESMKATITENLDVAEFTKMTTTEAKRVGLTVTSIRPLEAIKKEYYIEQPFEFSYRGAFVQLLVFMERIANLQRIVRIENFDLRPLGSARSRIVELQGTIQIKAYRYLGSKADELGKEAPAAQPGNQDNKEGGQ